METETKAKCRCFGMGGKIECRNENFWCDRAALCTYLHFCWGGGFMYFNRLYCVHIFIFSTVGWSDCCMVLENFDFNPKMSKTKFVFNIFKGFP